MKRTFAMIFATVAAIAHVLAVIGGLALARPDRFGADSGDSEPSGLWLPV
jgi:hypothetical protein